MAKIIITTDDGELVETLIDAEEEIGDVGRPLNRQHLMAALAEAVNRARRKEGRDHRGELE